MGIEPTALAWEARVLPLYDARRARYFTRIRRLWANRRMRAAPGIEWNQAESGAYQMPNSVSDTAARVTTISSTWTITNSRIGDRSMPPKRGMILRSGSRNGAVS